MKTTSSINFYCRQSKANKQGLAPIEASITVNGKRLFVNLPRAENPGTFKKDSEKKTSDLHQYLELYREKINSIQTILLRNGVAITAKNIREYLQTGGVESYTLEELFSEYFSLLRNRIGTDLNERTYRKYELVRDDFFKFIEKETEVTEITPAHIQTYYSIVNRTCTKETSAGKMTKLKAVFRYAFENGHTKTFPFSNIKIRKGTPAMTYLTGEEYRRLCDLDTGIERLERVRDLFILQCNSGLSYADLAILDPKGDIQMYEGSFYIAKDRVKTGAKYVSVILPDGLAILNKYDWDLKEIMLSNQNYNAYLKEIQDLCKIKPNMTTHLARRQYATFLLNNKVDMSVIARSLGHKSRNTSEKYYARLLDETVVETIEKAVISK